MNPFIFTPYIAEQFRADFERQSDHRRQVFAARNHRARHRSGVT